MASGTKTSSVGGARALALVILILAAAIDVAEAKGGGRGGGGRSSGGGSRSSGGGVVIIGSGGGGGGGGDSSGVLIFLVIAVTVLVVACCCYYLVKASADDDDGYSDHDGPTTPCYLCLRKIPDGPWNSGSHRRSCAVENGGFLAGLPTMSVRCPKCEEPLKKWPERGPEFYCEGVSCPRMGAQRNVGGTNRYNCFKCDYDLCLHCYNRKAALTMISCSLCHDPVLKSSWSASGHRALCASRNAAVLNNMVSTSVKCPQCQDPLKQWSIKEGRFGCNSGACNNPRGLSNEDGHNRFRCYRCDYDLCNKCFMRAIYGPDSSGAAPPLSVSTRDGPIQMIRCSLCQHAVLKSTWSASGHRADCAAQNATLLDSMASTSVPCPQCRDPLKEWSIREGTFGCNSGTCESENPRRLSNEEGHNRFRCFRCDYDLCSKCYVKATYGSHSSPPSAPSPWTAPTAPSAPPPPSSVSIDVEAGSGGFTRPPAAGLPYDLQPPPSYEDATSK